tara:strand:+ start:309 stop:473 length:165 start_codon:yes stop_codon:yes gene_type:complete
MIMTRGIVKKYDRLKEFGLITGDDDEDYFVYVNGLRKHLKGREFRRVTASFILH